MRKKIATLLLAFAFILPCSLFFSACGKEDDVKVNGISVELISNDYTLTDKTITVSYGGKVELDADDFKVTASLSNGKTKVITEKTETSDGFTFESTLPTDNKTPVGNYKLTFSHDQVEEDLEITINVVKATVDMSQVSWNYTNPITYDGEDKVVELTNLPEGVSVVYQGNSARDAGTYTATAIFSYVDTNNYEAIPSMTKTWQIVPAKYATNVTATLKSEFEGIKYTGSNQTVELNINNADTSNVRATIVPETITAKDAGTYYARVNLEYIGASNNYDGVATEYLTVEWKIEKAELIVTAKDHSIIYGDAPSNNGVQYTGFVNGEDESVLSNALGFDYTYSVGDNAEKDYTITPKGLTSNNYEIEFVSGKLNVAKKNLTLKVNPVTINYNTDATNNGIQPTTDFISTDTLAELGTLVFNYGGYEKGDNVGTYDITVDIDWFDKDNINYNVICEKANLEVVKIDVDVDADDISLKQTVFTYTGKDLSSLLDVEIAAEGVSKDYITVETNAPIEVGTYTAVIYLKYFDTVNYNSIPEIKKEFRIEPATVASFDNVALDKSSMSYTGKLQEVEFTNVPEGAKIGSITGNSATNANKVGEKYTVEVTFVCKDTKNYVDFGTVTKTFDWNITPVKLIITAKNHEIFYNEAAANNGVDYAGFVNNEDASVLAGNIGFDYTYSVGDNAEKDYTITPKGLTSTNYDIEFKPGKLTVKKAEIDFANISWVVASPYTYSGNAVKPVLNNEFDNVEYTYTYFRVVGEENPTYEPIDEDEIVNVGKYIAHVAIELKNQNYTIINNSIEDCEFVIVAQKVDVSSLTWNMGNEVTFTGEEIKPIISNLLSTLNVVKYTYTKGGENAEPVNVGTYVASVELATINNNYEIEGTCESLTYTITPKPVDCANLAWVETNEFTYNTNFELPHLFNVPAETVAHYTYTDMEGNEVETPIDAGQYIAIVEVEPINNNYTLINYTELHPFTFEILKAEIDITNLNWATDVTEFEYNGTEIKPVLNVENIDGVLTFTYKYTNKQWVEEDGVPVEKDVEVSPINVDTYTAWAIFNYDADNYVLVENDEEVAKDMLTKEYLITKPAATIGEIDWNIKTNLYDKSEYSQYHYLAMDYTGSTLDLGIVCDDLTMFNVEYYVDHETVENVAIKDAGYHYVYALITLKDEYVNNYKHFEYCVYLNLEIVENPFTTLTVNGVEISYVEFREKTTYEYGDEIAFQTKEGFTVYDREGNVLISPLIVDSYELSFILKDAENLDLMRNERFNYYYIKEVSIGSNTYSLENGNSIQIKLGKDDTSFEIDFDERYLTKYNSMLSYSVEYSNKEPAYGQITTLPLVIEDATNVNRVYISIQKEMGSYESVIWIDVEQYSRVKGINYKTISLEYNGENLVENNEYLSVNLYNDLLVEFSATLEDGYTAQYFMDEELTQELNFTDLTNLKAIYVAVYYGEELVEIKPIYVYFNLSGNGYSLTNICELNVSDSEFSIDFECGNSNVAVSNLINGKETITLTEDFTTVNYVFSATYNSKTYTYTREFKIIKSYSISQFVEYDNVYEISLTYTETGKTYAVNGYNNYVGLWEDFDASNIKNLDITKLSLPLVEGYTVVSQEMVAVDGRVYLKLTLTYQNQGEEPLVENVEEFVVILLLNIYGEYNNDTTGRIELYNIFEGNKTPIDLDASVINIDIGTQSLDVTLNNMYAVAYITNEDGTQILMQTKDGYFDGVYTFKQTGTYLLRIVATDGTVKTYTINVTGEIIPILTVEAGGQTLTQTMGANGPTEGSFVWKTLDEYGQESSFSAVLGNQSQELISQEGKFTITSVNSPMLSNATIFDNDGNPIIDVTKSFELTVLGDAVSPYVMFYAETEEGSKSYIYLYLCDVLPATKALEIVYNGTTYTQYLNEEDDSTYGSFESFTDGPDMIFIGYVGEQTTPTDTITLTSLYFIYPVTIKDMFTQEVVSPDSLTISVQTDPESGLRCAALALEFNPVEGYTVSMHVILYLAEKTETLISFTIGETEYAYCSNGEGTIKYDDVKSVYYVYLGEGYVDGIGSTFDVNKLTIKGKDVVFDYFTETPLEFENGVVPTASLQVGEINEFESQKCACIDLGDNTKLCIIFAAEPQM